jgi:outer membrane protein assembly factor BamB
MQPGDDNFDIFLYDFTTGTRKKICDAKKRQDYPQVSKDWAIWRDWRNCQSSQDDLQNCEIYGFNISDGKEFLIKDLNSSGTAELFNEYAILSIKTAEKNDFDIYLYVLETKKMIPICTAPGDQISPKIIGNTIVWIDCRTCNPIGELINTNVFGYSLSTKKEFNISTLTSREYSLTAGDRFIAWLSQSSTSFSGTMKANIVGYDTISSKTYNITEKSGYYSNVSVAGRYCVYEVTDPDSDFGSDIKVYDFQTGKTWWVYRGYGDQRNPNVYGDTVVWEDHGGFDSESITIWSVNLKNPTEKTEPPSYGSKPVNIWTTAHGNNQRTSLSNCQIKKTNENPFNIQWTFDMTEITTSTPIFDKKGYAYFGSDDSKFYSVNVFDGQKSWDFQTLGKVKGSAALYMERVFFGDDKGVFYCLNSQSGQEIWRFQTGGAITCSPLAFQSDIDHYGCVVFSSSDKKMYLLNALSKTPTVKWTYELEGWLIGTPSVDYNSEIKFADREATSKVIYACTTNNRLLCISASTGKLLSFANFKPSLNSHPIVFGSKVLVATNEGMLFGSDFSAWGMEPSITFKEDTNHQLYGSVVYDQAHERLCFESSPGVLKCVQEKDGWHLNLNEPVKTTPIVLVNCINNSSVLACATMSGKIVFIDTSNGSQLASVQLDSSTTTSLSVYDTGYPAIIVGTKDKKLVCISQRPKFDD